MTLIFEAGILGILFQGIKSSFQYISIYITKFTIRTKLHIQHDDEGSNTSCVELRSLCGGYTNAAASLWSREIIVCPCLGDWWWVTAAAALGLTWPWWHHRCWTNGAPLMVSALCLQLIFYCCNRWFNRNNEMCLNGLIWSICIYLHFYYVCYSYSTWSSF